MAYGEIKIDTITFTAGGSDTSISVSGLVQNPTFTGNITTTGTISGDVIRGQTVSGVTVTGSAGEFGTITGNTAGFTTVTGTTVTGTTANFVTVSGTTVTGDTGQFTNITGVNIVGTTQVSGATVTGNIGLFTTITGGIHTLTSGVFASGTAANPSITFVDDLDTGLFTGAANTVSIGTNGVAVLTVSGTNVGIGTSSVSTNVDIVDATKVNIAIKKNGLGIEANSSLSSTYDVVQLGAGGSFASYNTETATADTLVGHNFYRHSGGTYKYKYDDAALRIRFNSSQGYMYFDRAAPGSADADLTFSTSLTIDDQGRVGINTTSPGYRLHCVGDARFETSNVFLDDDNKALVFGTGTTAYIIGSSANNNIRFVTNASESARIDANGRLLVGSTLVSGQQAGKFVLNNSSSVASQAAVFVKGNNNSQGTATKFTIVRHCPVVSLGTKLKIPFVSQGSLNSTTTCKVWGHSARFNNASPSAFEITFAVGHLTTLSNLASWGGQGNFSSIAISGMTIEITFTGAYTSGTANGVYVCIEYMTNAPDYSIDIPNIQMN